MRRPGKRQNVPANPESAIVTPATHSQLVTKVRTLLAEAQALSTRLAAFNEIAVAMQASLDTDAMLRTMAQQARWVLDFQYCAVVLGDGDRYHYQLLHGQGALPGCGDQPWQPDPVLRDVLMHGYPKVLHEQPADRMPPGMRSAIFVPLYDQDSIIGALNFYADDPRRYGHDDLRIAYALALQASAVLRNARLYDAATRTRDELHTIIESISDAVLVLDTHGCIVYANRALQQMLYQDAPLASGRSAIWLVRARDRQQRRIIDAQQARTVVAATRQADGSSTVLRLQDGRYIEWICVPIAGRGVLNGYVLSGRDISARIGIEQLRDDQIHMLVHDLRAPVAGILMGLEFLEIAQQEGRPIDLATIARMRQAGSSLLKRINTTLELRQLEAGQITLNLADTAVDELIDRAIAAMRPLADAKKHAISVAIEQPTERIWLDGPLIQRVLENLISNALKYMEQPGFIRVSAAVATDRRAIMFGVRDTGPGVPEALRRHIFDKYGRGDGTGSGSGLGLAFCKLAVEAHGGDIGVRDAPGRGAMFWFTLPLAGPHKTADG